MVKEIFDLNDKEKKPEFDLEFIKTYMALSAKEKLEYLEELNRFLDAAMPEKSKKAWEELCARKASSLTTDH